MTIDGSDSPDAALKIVDLKFGWDDTILLDVPHFELAAGERVFLKGPSGSGKSTLLSLISGVLAPPRDTVFLMGEDIGAMTSGARDAMRASKCGVIFQMFNLLPYLSVLDNVLLPCGFSRARADIADKNDGRESEARRLLAALGLNDDLFDRKATMLSVGQQQRVAAARALIGAPGLILADEPTSALDDDAQHAFLELLIEQCEASKASLIFVSHDQSLTSLFQRVVNLRDINLAAQRGQA